ncbi:MAG: DNA-binding protein [Pseudomonadota bacterium]
MSTSSVKKPKAASIRLSAGSKPLSAAEVKTQLQERGVTLKDWAEGNGYAYDTVSCVVRGVHRASYGVGHRIAVQLGMKKAA